MLRKNKAQCLGGGDPCFIVVLILCGLRHLIPALRWAVCICSVVNQSQHVLVYRAPSQQGSHHDRINQSQWILPHLRTYGYIPVLSPGFRKLMQIALQVTWFYQDLSQKCSVGSSWIPSGPKLNLEYYSCVFVALALVAQAVFELGLHRVNLGVLPSIL